MSDYRNYPVGPGKHCMVDLDDSSVLSDVQVDALVAYQDELAEIIRRDMKHSDKIVGRLVRSAEAKVTRKLMQDD